LSQYRRAVVAVASGVSILLCLVTVIAAMVGVILTVPPGA
jgi:hypothetical protein